MKPIALILISLSLSACTTSAVLENALAAVSGIGGSSRSTSSKMVQTTNTDTNTSVTCKPAEVKVVLQDGNKVVEEYCMEKPNTTTNTQPNPFYEENKEEVALTTPTKQQPATKEYPAPTKQPQAKTAKATTPKAKAPAKKTKTETKTAMPKGKVTCSSFSSHAQAQAYFKARKPGWKKLDKDKDGIACESL